jgi:hypothetical protein
MYNTMQPEKEINIVTSNSEQQTGSNIRLVSQQTSILSHYDWRNTAQSKTTDFH